MTITVKLSGTTAGLGRGFAGVGSGFAPYSAATGYTRSVAESYDMVRAPFCVVSVCTGL